MYCEREQFLITQERTGLDSFAWLQLVRTFRLATALLERAGFGAAGLVVASCIAIVALVRPLFGFYRPASVSSDFVNHIALVGGALETLRATHAVPISSDLLVPGTEYPYFLFGNAGFYVVAAFMSFVLNTPAAVGAACALSAGLIAGQVGTYALTRSFGLSRAYSVVIGFLYATGPYLCINLLVRADFPEFLAGETAPLLCFLGRRAMEPRAGFVALAGLSVAMALPMYLHKLVGPHIVLFEVILILANARLSPGWLLRLLSVGVSVPCLAVFAWLPILGLDRNQVLTFKVGSMGQIIIVDDSLVDYVWPWVHNSLPASLRLPEYGDRFGLQLGLLASIGLVYGAWRLGAAHFRPRSKELLVGVLGGIIYSALVLGSGGLVEKLPFPLNTIQFSYRLIGMAALSGTLALIAALGERPPPTRHWRDYLLPAALALVIAASVVTYWRPPPLSDAPQTSVVPSDLADTNTFYSKTFKSLFDTSGAVAPDGALSPRPFPMGLGAAIEHNGPDDAHLVPPESRGLPLQTIYLVGRVNGFNSAPADVGAAVLRVYALHASSVQPCASDSELPMQQPDVISALLSLCRARVPQAQDLVVGLVGAWKPKLLIERNVGAAGPVELRLSIPEDSSFVAIECGIPRCISIDYLGPANQPAGRVVVPQAAPSWALERGPFGQWRVHASSLPPGDYVLPTFDYPFVRVTSDSGMEMPIYQFDSRPVIRHDGAAHTYSVWYDLSPELAILAAWGAIAGVALLAVWVYRRRV